MQVLNKQINIACPICGTEKIVNIPETLFKEKKFGHVKVQVPQGAVCQDHVFIVLLDMDGRILGYQTVDLSVSSKAEPKTKDQDSIEKDESLGLMKFIRMLGFRCFAGLIHSKLFHYEPYIIMPENCQLNVDEINYFLEDVVPEKYRNKIVLKKIEYDDDVFPHANYFYDLVKNKRKTEFLINPDKHIIQMPWQTGLELEKNLIASAIQNEKHLEQIKFLSFYLTKFIEDTNKAMIIIEPLKKISKRELVKKLKDIAITSTVTKDYVTSIKEFIHRQISPEIAKKIKN
jgi:hypothetical protein